jgi:thiol:disulfide interchange protein
LVRETHQDPAVVQALNDTFIPVRFEGRAHMDLVQQFQVKGAPTTILFSPNGDEKLRIVGFQTAEEYLKELSQGGLGPSGN